MIEELKAESCSFSPGRPYAHFSIQFLHCFFYNVQSEARTFGVIRGPVKHIENSGLMLFLYTSAIIYYINMAIFTGYIYFYLYKRIFLIGAVICYRIGYQVV
jgi:hypothetical protein